MADFTAPQTGRYAFGAQASDSPEGSSTVVEFDTTEWQTVAPRTWTELVGDPGSEIYHEGPGAIRILVRKAPTGERFVMATSNSGGALEMPDNATTFSFDHP